MLLHYNPSKPVYVVGQGISADELYYWISQITKLVELVSTEEYLNLPGNSQCILGVQNFDYRHEFFQKISMANRRWVSYIHPTAYITQLDLIGTSVVVGPNVTTGYKTQINNFSCVCQSSSIGHNTVIGKNNVVSPNTTIGGSTIIGDNVLIGQASSIRDKISIVGNVRFLMSSAVTRDITESGIYFGNKKVPNA
jgi:UDP-3-O-[3-hydroxymyristoyl] glucosamine N-acyltransferase